MGKALQHTKNSCYIYIYIYIYIILVFAGYTFNDVEINLASRLPRVLIHAG